MSGEKSNKKRMRMRPWLVERLDSEDTPGAKWEDRPRGLFRISWVHAARNSYNADKDSRIFEKYAVHTGKEGSGDHRRYKANFRCALNSIKDQVEEVKSQSTRRGSDAVRVFRFLGWESGPATDFARNTPSPDSGSDMDTDAGDHSLAESTSPTDSDSFYGPCTTKQITSEADSGGISDSGSDTCLDPEYEDMVLEDVADMIQTPSNGMPTLTSANDPMLTSDPMSGVKNDPIQKVEMALSIAGCSQSPTLTQLCSAIDSTVYEIKYPDL